MITIEFGFVIEEFKLARPAGHEQEDDAVRPRGEMRRFRSGRIDEGDMGVAVTLEERAESHGADANAAIAEEMPAGLVEWIHVVEPIIGALFNEQLLAVS